MELTVQELVDFEQLEECEAERMVLTLIFSSSIEDGSRTGHFLFYAELTCKLKTQMSIGRLLIVETNQQLISWQC